MGNLDARRDLTDVRDTVRAYRLILERGTAGRVYNVCSGRAITIRELLDMMIARARVAVTAFKNRQIYPLAARLGAEVGKEKVCLFVSARRLAEVPDSVAGAVSVATTTSVRLAAVSLFASGRGHERYNEPCASG